MRFLLLLLLIGTAQAHERALEIVQAKCFLCHGLQGESASPLFPRLAGQHAAYIARQLADYKAGRRQSSAMQPMVADLDAADFEQLGRYFEAQTPVPHEGADPRLAAAGRLIHLQGQPGRPACASCHGEAAQGSAELPRLAGQHAQYLVNQLNQFHARQRRNDQAVMQGIAKRLSPQETEAVAAYLSGLP